MVRYRDEAPRPGYHLVRSQMTSFLVVSSFFSVIGYFGSLGIATTAQFENGSAWLAVPVAGPFVAMTKVYCGGFTPQRFEVDCGNANMIAAEGLLALGILQTVGAVLFPFGFLHRHYWQRNSVVPTVSAHDGLRLGVVGTF